MRRLQGYDHRGRSHQHAPPTHPRGFDDDESIAALPHLHQATNKFQVWLCVKLWCVCSNTDHSSALVAHSCHWHNCGLHMRSATPAQQQPCTIATASACRNLCRVVQATVCCLAEQAAGLALMGPSLCMQPGLVEANNSGEATDQKSIKALLNKLRPENLASCSVTWLLWAMTMSRR